MSRTRRPLRHALPTGIVAALALALTPAPGQPGTPTVVETDVIAVAPPTNQQYVASRGDTVFVLSETFAKGAVRTTTATGTALLSRDAGTTWTPVTVPVDAGGAGAFEPKGVVHDVAVGDDGAVYVVGSHVWRLDGTTWTPLPAFTLDRAEVFSQIEIGPDGELLVVRESYFSCLGTHRLLRSTDGGLTATELPLPDEGVVPTDLVVDEEGRVAMLVRYGYIINDHDCYVGDAPAGQFVTHTDSWDWTPLSLDGAFVSSAAWAGDLLAVTIGAADDTRYAGDLVGVVHVAFEDEVSTTLLDTARVPEDRTSTPAVTVGQHEVLGLDTDGSVMAVHTGERLLSFEIGADGTLGAGRVLVDHVEGTGTLWGSDSDRPVAFTAAGLLARDAATLYRVR